MGWSYSNQDGEVIIRDGEAVADPLAPKPTFWDTEDGADVDAEVRGYVYSDPCPVGMALFSGEWLLSDVTGVYDLAFRGEPFTSWSGGETFLAPRSTLERIARIQKDMAEADGEAGFDQIRFDGDEAFLVSPEGEEFPVQRSGAMYVIGFGWTWERLSDDDVVSETV
jgi:hypothetical protein